MEPYFKFQDQSVIAAPHGGGPWDPSMLHGGAPTALITRLVEDIPTKVPMRLTRLTIDLKRPVPVGQIDFDVTVTREGRNIHVHVNGDAGLDLVLDHVEAARKASPRPDGRIVLEHYGYAREDQHARVAELGIAVSNNAYYVHELAPIYAEHGLGPERAADISPLGGLARAGVPFSFHSDFPSSPSTSFQVLAAKSSRKIFLR